MKVDTIDGIYKKDGLPRANAHVLLLPLRGLQWRSHHLSFQKQQSSRLQSDISLNVELKEHFHDQTTT
jgi:hypothetical protein